MITMAFKVTIKTNDYQKEASKPKAAKTLKNETVKNLVVFFLKAD